MKGSMLEFQDHSGTDDANKKILTTTTAFGVLRKGLIENLGTKRAKGFLLRYGWSLGVGDAEEAMKTNPSIDYLIKQASILHLSTGHIKDIQSERFIQMSDSDNIESILGKGKWIDSFEAGEHLKHHGKSEIPVCHTLTGYASGYMSTICKKRVIVKEISCIGKGDAECYFEARLEKDWGNEINDEIKHYSEMNIIDELEYTYEQLLEQRDYIEKVSKFHKKLTESVSNGSNLQDIADTTFELLNIPVSIEDLSFQKIAFSGISEEQYKTLNKDFKDSLQNKKNKIPAFNETTKQKTAWQERLISPIIVQRKIIGYFTFFYLRSNVKIPVNDFMFIERAANAASLYLLNEKASFEALEKMKGYFLEQILKGEYSSKEEMIKRGRYLGFNFSSPFYIAAIECVDKSDAKNLDYIDSIIETIVKYMDIQGYKALIGQYQERIIMLIPDAADIFQKMNKVLKHLQHTNSSFQYKIGISDITEDIAGVPENLEESFISLRMSTEKKIVFFKDLGIVGVLINSKNISGIRKIAKQELRTLYNSRDEKRNELIRTLYVFLLNGGKLQKTMEDLSLSMSGLTYRINKIESMLNKDLRDSTQSYQLLLILDSLIALGELKI